MSAIESPTIQSVVEDIEEQKVNIHGGNVYGTTTLENNWTVFLKFKYVHITWPSLSTPMDRTRKKNAYIQTHVHWSS